MSNIVTERIALLLEGNTAGAAGAAAIAVERLDKGLSQAEHSMTRAGRAASQLEVLLAKDGATADEVGKAFGRLVGEIRKYNESQVNKAMHNEVLKAAKEEVEANERKYQDAIERQEKYNADLRKEQKYALAIDEKIKENRFREEAREDERKYQDAIERQEKYAKRMRDGESPFGTGKHSEPKQRKPWKERAARGGVQWVGKNFGPTGVAAIGNTAEMLEKIGPIAAKVGPAFASAAVGVAAFSVAAATGAGYAAKEFGGAVIEAQAYKEDLSEAFKKIRKEQGDADAVMKRAVETADYLGMKRPEGAGMFLDMLPKFKDVGVVDHLMRSLADLETLDPKAKIPELVSAMGKMQGKGYLTAEILDSLNAAGLEQGDVVTELGKKYSKTAPEIMKMISAQKISADTGREAIEATITEQRGGGLAGSAAHEKANKNLSKLIERVKDIPSNILFDVEVGPGVDGVKGVLRDILDWFDPKTGRGTEVRKVAGDLFNALVEGLTGKKVDTSKGITGTLDTVLAGAKEAVPVVRELAGGTRELLGFGATVMSVAGSITELTGGIGSVGAAWKGLTMPTRILFAPMTAGLSLLPELYQGFRGIGALVSGDTTGAMERFRNMLPGGEFADKFVDAAQGVPDKIGVMMDGVGAAVRTKASTLFNEALGVGTSIVDGLEQGITSRAARAWGAITSVADGIVTAAKGALDSHSPSRIMIDLGGDTTMGLPIGIERRAPKAYAAANDVGSGVVASLMAGMKPANDGGLVASLMASRPAGSIGYAPGVSAAANTPTGTTINVTFAPVIKADGGRSEAENRAAAAAAVAGSQEEFDRMLAVSMRRLRAAGGF